MAIFPESSTSASGATCNKPAGTSVGDVLVAVAFGLSDAGSISGFTPQATATLSGVLHLRLLTRVVDGTEGATFTVTGGTRIATGMTRFSGVDTTNPVEGTPTAAAAGNSATASPASITTITNDAMLVIGGAGFDGAGNPITDVSFSAGTEQWEQVNGNHRLALATETIATAGSTGSRTVTIEWQSSQHAFGAMLALKPAATGTPGTITLSTGNVDIAGTSLTVTGQQSGLITLGTGNMDIAGTSLTVTGGTSGLITLSAGNVDIAGSSLTVTGGVGGLITLTTGNVDIAGTTITVTGQREGLITLSTGNVDVAGTSITVTGQQAGLITLTTGDMTIEGGSITVIGQRVGLITLTTGEMVIEGVVITVHAPRLWDGTAESLILTIDLEGSSAVISGPSGLSAMIEAELDGTTVQSTEYLAESIME